MKALTTIARGVLALAFVGSAFADPVVIHIVGSNGDRVISNTAIPKLLTGTLTFAGTNNDPLKANFGTWTGGSFNGTPVTIKVAYIGATGGIAAVAGSLPVKFLPDGATGGGNVDPTTTSDSTKYESAVPNFTLSTNFQGTSPFQGEYQGHTYETLTTDLIIGVIPLKWLASKNYPGDTNFTTQQAQALYLIGTLPLSVFSGDNADINTLLFAVGRNTDAGQRYVALLESGLNVNSVVKQYKPTITGASAGVGGFVTGGTVTSQVLWPQETVSGVDSGAPGNSGAATGSALAPFLTATLSSNAYTLGGAHPNATAGYYIGYLTNGDANTIAIPNGAVELKWNGVPYSAANVQSGKYTFWTYEHILYKDGIAETPKAFADALATQILNTDAAVGGLLYNDVKASRNGDGGLVTPDLDF